MTAFGCCCCFYGSLETGPFFFSSAHFLSYAQDLAGGAGNCKAGGGGSGLSSTGGMLIVANPFFF